MPMSQDVADARALVKMSRELDAMRPRRAGEGQVDALYEAESAVYLAAVEIDPRVAELGWYRFLREIVE